MKIKGGSNNRVVSKAWIYLAYILLLIVFISVFSACDKIEDAIKGVGKNNQTTYFVPNSFFSKPEFESSTLRTFGVNRNTESEERYSVKISSFCPISLFEYHIQAVFYSEVGEIIYIHEQGYTKAVEANAVLTSDVVFNKEEYLKIDINSTRVTWQGSSYEEPKALSTTQSQSSSNNDAPRINTPVFYQVRLVYNNGIADRSFSVKEGDRFSTPLDPSKSNYIFTGWYISNSLTDKYDFACPVCSDITLYAGYELDAKMLTNKISETYMRSIVKVYSESYNTFLGIPTQSECAQGSGFCFSASKGYYYILTNCHVVRKREGYKKHKITIEDYKGNSYEGHIYMHSTGRAKAIDPAYDLACLWFKPKSTEVKPLVIGSNPSTGDDVISVSAPKGQSNCISFGNVKSLIRARRLNDCDIADSNVKFDVIYHNALIDHGSSGSALINPQGKVVGVNYASGERGQSVAIPASKIKEFVKKYVL